MPRSALKYLLVFVVLAGVSMGAFGCSWFTSDPNTLPPLDGSTQIDPPAGSKMLNANIYAGDALSSILLKKASAGSGILATSLVDMDTLEASSAFGRTSSQQIASRISQNGFKMIEVRMANDMAIDIKQGEFMLSRRVANLLKRDYDAHAVMVGIYSRSVGKVFVSVRVVRLADSVVLAAYEYYLPYDADVAYLLGRGQTTGGGGKAVGTTENDAAWRKYAIRPKACPDQTSDVLAKPQNGNGGEKNVGKDTPSPQKDDPAPQYEPKHVPDAGA